MQGERCVVATRLVTADAMKQLLALFVCWWGVV